MTSTKMFNIAFDHQLGRGSCLSELIGARIFKLAAVRLYVLQT